MPFSPMHELAKKYKLEPPMKPFELVDFQYYHIEHTLEIQYISANQAQLLAERVMYRMRNTMAALDKSTQDTVCINLGGGMHHAEKYPNTGYAYSLINDICWAVDYQLEQNKTVGIIDLDFHFGGGTYEYYFPNKEVGLLDIYHPKGILYQHEYMTQRMTRHQWETARLATPDIFAVIPETVDKILLNLGTDWYNNDALFGQYGNMEADDLLNVWKETVRQITVPKIPLAITCGGGYGDEGLALYERLIDWLRAL